MSKSKLDKNDISSFITKFESYIVNEMDATLELVITFETKWETGVCERKKERKRERDRETPKFFSIMWYFFAPISTLFLLLS